MLEIENNPTVLHIEIGRYPIADIEQKLIFATLDIFHGNKARTAQSLGIALKTLYNKLEKYEAA